MRLFVVVLLMVWWSACLCGQDEADRDVALSAWYLEQGVAMDTLGLEESVPERKVRLQSYAEVSKLRMGPREVVRRMRRVLAEFEAGYKGEDKKVLLEEWSEAQRKAAKGLQAFLEAAGDKGGTPPKLEGTKALLEAQLYYLRRVDALSKKMGWEAVLPGRLVPEGAPFDAGG